MSVTTRRRFIQAASTRAALAPPAARAQAAPRRIVAYVGTYSAPDGSGRGEGIHLLEMDPATGALTPRDVFRTSANPSWLALDRTRTHLYSANEVAAAETGAGTVTVLDQCTTGRLTLLNAVSSEGAGPAHMSIHPAGKHALVANYGGGTIAVLPIQPDGRLGAASDVKRSSRHDGAGAGVRRTCRELCDQRPRPAARAHDRQRRVRTIRVVADLGLDQIFVWRFDDAKGALTPNDPPSVSLPPGDGPRHFAFHSKGRWFYSLQEEASTVVAFDYDAANGRLSAKQTISTLPRGFAGTNFTSGIVVSPDARFVYVANRLHDSIAWLSISGDGTLRWVGEEWTRGDYPRSFTIDPTGRFLFSCNQRSDAIACFRVDAKSGRLTFTGQYRRSALRHTRLSAEVQWRQPQTSQESGDQRSCCYDQIPEGEICSPSAEGVAVADRRGGGGCLTERLVAIIRSRMFFVIRWMRTSLRRKSLRGGFWNPGGDDNTTFHQQVPALNTRLPLGAV